MKIEYRQRLDKMARRVSDVWHFHITCQHWPTKWGRYRSRFAKPTTGELCNQCRSKSKRR